MANEVAQPGETLDQQFEKITIAAVMAAINVGFNPGGNRELNLKNVVDTCAILVAFLDEAGKQPNRTIRDWKLAIENLRITLGPDK